MFCLPRRRAANTSGNSQRREGTSDMWRRCVIALQNEVPWLGRRVIKLQFSCGIIHGGSELQLTNCYKKASLCFIVMFLHCRGTSNVSFSVSPRRWVWCKFDCIVIGWKMRHWAASWIVSLERRLSENQAAATTAFIKNGFQCWKSRKYLAQISETGAKKSRQS